ncbi:MAG TPA: DinB family protein [Flavitalea sp.]|nr:DinB family protein [Flavitalea sp.]
MEQQLQKEVSNALADLVQTLTLIDEKEINIVPFEGSWTAGQLAQHIIMSNSGFDELMNGPVKDTERKSDELIEGIRTSFLDFSHKMQSPDFVLPLKIDYNKHELLQSLSKIKEQLDKTLKGLDLTKTCTGFEIPVLGYLTRLEAAHFVLSHTKRHTHQLKNIAVKLASANNVSAN